MAAITTGTVTKPPLENTTSGRSFFKIFFASKNPLITLNGLSLIHISSKKQSKLKILTVADQGGFKFTIYERGKKKPVKTVKTSAKHLEKTVKLPKKKGIDVYKRQVIYLNKSEKR